MRFVEEGEYLIIATNTGREVMRMMIQRDNNRYRIVFERWDKPLTYRDILRVNKEIREHFNVVKEDIAEVWVENFSLDTLKLLIYKVVRNKIG